MSKEVIELAIEIAGSRDSELPSKLLKIRNIVDRAIDPDRIRHELYSYDLLQAISLSLKHEFGYIKDGWNIAAELVRILCDCLHGLFISDKSYEQDLLPNTAQNILILARKYQEKHSRSKGLSDENLYYFKSVMKQYSLLHSYHPNLVLRSLRSERLLQLLISDELETSIVTINVLREIMEQKRTAVSKLDDKILFSILDEVIYKLTTSDSLEMGLGCIQLLILLCKLDPYFNKQLYRRYKGLKMLLSKWYGKGIGKELKELTQMLEDADKTKSSDDKERHYAIIVQKAWRGYIERKRLKKVNEAFAKFQRRYRNRTQKKEDDKQRQMAENELKFQLEIEHLRKIRQRKLNMAELLQIMPPEQINKYLHKQKVDAATLIQANYRGYRQRKKFQEQKSDAIEFKAAVCIQRAVRRFLERKNRKQMEPAYYARPPGLTHEKRESLLEKIRNHLDTLPPHPRSDKEVNELHEKAQHKFKNYVTSQKDIRKQQQQIQVLWALTNNDADLLLNCPKLHEVNEDDVNNYYSHKSVPVMLAAKNAHKKAMRKAKSKWYELLMDDSDSDEDNTMEFSHLMNIYDTVNYNTLSGNNKLTGLNKNALHKTVPKSEKDKLKSTTFKRPKNIPWIEGEDATFN